MTCSYSRKTFADWTHSRRTGARAYAASSSGPRPGLRRAHDQVPQFARKPASAVASGGHDPVPVGAEPVARPVASEEIAQHDVLLGPGDEPRSRSVLGVRDGTQDRERPRRRRPHGRNGGRRGHGRAHPIAQARGRPAGRRRTRTREGSKPPERTALRPPRRRPSVVLPLPAAPTTTACPAVDLGKMAQDGALGRVELGLRVARRPWRLQGDAGHGPIPPPGRDTRARRIAYASSVAGKGQPLATHGAKSSSWLTITGAGVPSSPRARRCRTRRGRVPPGD